MKETRPSNGAFGDMSGIDNLNVYFGSNEILKPDSLFLKEVYENARKTGHFVEYEGMFHTFPMFPIPEGFKAIKQIVKVITPNSSLLTPHS